MNLPADTVEPLASRRVHWANHVMRHAHMKPDSTAVRFQDETITWGELDERGARLAAVFTESGVEAGDRIALLMTNRPEFLDALLAAARLGAIAVPINFRLTADEVAFIVGDSGCTLVVTDEALQPLLAAVPSSPTVLVVGGSDVETSVQARMQSADPGAAPRADVHPDTAALIMYTSGTTGRPKGAVLSHQNLYTQATTLIRAWRLFDSDTEKNLVASPLFHIGALGSIGPSLLIGATVVLQPTGAFDPTHTLDVLEREQITTVFLVPTQWQALVNDPTLPDRRLVVRVICWGAAPATTTLLDQMNKAFPGAANVAVFGQTETTAVTCVLEGKDAIDKIGSIGKPVDTVLVRVVDEMMNDVAQGDVGEIVYRGPAVMEGYWNNPAATAEAFEAGWFHSGDLVRVDEDGFYYVVDRKKDMIISGGENIYCAEIENALAAHPGILDVAIIGCPDDRWGEVPVAVIVPRDPADPPTPDAIISWLEPRLARYKHPKQIEILGELPRNASGKVVKGVLRDQFGKAPALDPVS